MEARFSIMNDSLGLLKDLPQRANQLLDIWPKEKWHHRALEILEKGYHKGKPLGIACSGGADSTFCLLLIYAAFPKWRKQMILLHYNHQLRGLESDGDESFVSTMSKALGLSCVIEKPLVRTHKLDENTLRVLRLNFWKKVKKEKDISTIIQGHHLDDIAETLLWRIPRGTSVDGLISPKPISQIDNINILRPFISITKDLIREFLREYSVPWREDSSNLEDKYLRNKIRQSVLPVWKESSDRKLLQGVESTRDLLEKDSEALDFHAHESFRRCRSGEQLKTELLMRLPEATQRRVLQKWIVENTDSEEDSAKLVPKAKLLIEVFQKKEFSVIQISDRHFFYKRGGYLYLKAKNSIMYIPQLATVEDCPLFLANGMKILIEQEKLGKDLIDQIFKKKINPEREAYLSTKSLKGSPFIRSRLSGDIFKPMGSPGSKKVSDLMIDRKWSESQKVETPVFVNSSNEIVWIPGFPPAEFTKVTPTDKWVIRLTYGYSGT